jgi:hypothetical protein
MTSDGSFLAFDTTLTDSLGASASLQTPLAATSRTPLLTALDLDLELLAAL